MHRLILACTCLLALLLFSCADKESGESSTDGQEQTGSDTTLEQLPGIDYKEVEVANGGTIRGRVVVAGNMPELPEFEITANQDICAGAADNNRLEVGPDGGIAWAVVRLVGIKEGKAFSRPGQDNLLVDQVGCRYTPHVLAAPVGLEVTFLNSDPTAHNVRVEDTTEKILMNVAQPHQGNSNTFAVEGTGPFSIGCDYHPWMNAYVFGVDNPYYAVTGPDGTFEIRDIPEGEYQLHLWLNGLKAIPRRDNRGAVIRYQFAEPEEVTRKVTVQGGEIITEDFSIKAE